MVAALVSNAEAQVTRVSLATGGQSAGTTTEAAISADGRYVAFVSAAADLVPDDTNGVADVFVRDRQAGTTTRISVASDNSQANGPSRRPALSADGRFIVFDTAASNLVANDTNQCPSLLFDDAGCLDVFLHDHLLHTTVRVSVSTGGGQALGDSFAATISADGAVVAFLSSASNLVTDPSTPSVDVFVRSLPDGVTTRVNRPAGSTTANSVFTHQLENFTPSLSAAGRHVAFVSRQTDLVQGDDNANCLVDLAGLVNCPDVFLHDRATGQTTLVSQAGGMLGNRGGDSPIVSANGRYVAFRTGSSNFELPNLPPMCQPSGQAFAGYAVYIRDLAGGTTTRTTPVPTACGGSGTEQMIGRPAMSSDARWIAVGAPQTWPGQPSVSMRMS